MRSLYWKIFFSFWIATILIILTTAWVTHTIAKKSSVTAREQVFMDSYANAAIATFESGKRDALINWLDKTGIRQHMALYLITSQGEIIGPEDPPESIKQIGENLVQNNLDEGIVKSGDLIVSHEILSTSGTAYRLAAITEKPLSHFVEMRWAGLGLRLFIGTIISGLICYFLSIYLTKPLRQITRAAKLIATGKLTTRVDEFSGHQTNEIAELSDEFNRMAEQIEALVQSKERLLQDISHELRSPLARLQIALELAREKAKPEAENEFKRMGLECERLDTLLNEILEFTKLEQPTTTLKKTEVDLPNLLNQIIDDANYEFSSGTPRVQISDIQPSKLMLDGRLIRRVIENILRNALYYSPSSESVFVSLHWNVQHNLVVIEIRDHGPGIPDDQLTKIFNPFYRADSAREKQTGGFGLGLSIAQQAIALHHGEIHAKNLPEGGFLVTIILPADGEHTQNPVLL